MEKILKLREIEDIRVCQTPSDCKSNITTEEQIKVEKSVLRTFEDLHALLKVNSDLPVLLKGVHQSFLINSLKLLPNAYESLDASRCWLCYWILHALALMGVRTDDAQKSEIAKFLGKCQSEEGGFGGGPGQYPHLATTYAAVNALAILGTEEAYKIVDREKLYRFLKNAKQPDGSYAMQIGGEIDIRGAYCALSAASLTGILDSELTENTAEWLVSCQTYEGGFSGCPGMEAHGGYAFCGLAALVILQKGHLCDSQALLRWLVNKQMKLEGGFQGRTNKLVDSCYSFWQGGAFPLLYTLLAKDNLAPNDHLFDEGALQEYILLCSQNSHGGMIDKPGKARDLYHTCYALSGLSVAQHFSNQKRVLGSFRNELAGTHPLYNIRPDLETEEMLDDPLCNPEKPVIVTFEEVTSAAYKIRNGITYTPCDKSHLSNLTGMDIYLKKDFLQYTGSFKERGARYAMTMLTPRDRERGVIAASLGNHALAVCYHGYQLGIEVTVVMPIIAPMMKIQKCRDYKANVIIEGNNMEEAKRVAYKISREKGLTYINGYDHPQIIAGQGTIALEILEQVQDIDAIVVPTGGGGLLAGVAVVVKQLNPKIKIIGVESEKCASYTWAVKNNGPVATAVEGTLADGLAVSQVGYNSWKTSKDLIDKLVVVKEEWIAIAILRFIEDEKCVVEGAGACGLAAILAGQLEEFKGKRVVLILSGGNIDTTILGRCLERGLAADGRLVKCKVTTTDRPGGICELCGFLSSIGVSIKDIMHERAWITEDVYRVEISVVCETSDFAHSIQLRNLLLSKYKRVSFENFVDPNMRMLNLKTSNMTIDSC